MENRGAGAQVYLNVMIPVLIEFVTWVLQSAVRSGKERLYFLARDGYQMYLAACQLCRLWGLELDCRYLKVSRYSLRIPEYFLLREKCLDRICIGGIDVTFGKIMKRAALTEQEGMEIARLIGFESRYHDILNYQEVMGLKQKLRGQERFFEYIYRYSEEAYPAAIGYLKQEGLLEDVPYALVDSGWTGTLQQTLENLLQAEKKGIRLEGYYFGLYELPAQTDKNSYHSFYFQPKKGLRRKVYFSNSLFEAIFSAPEGMTMKYAEEGSAYLPVLNREENQNQQQMEESIALLQRYLKAYEEDPADQSRGMPATADIGIAEKLLSKCMGEPTELELEAYGENIFSDDILEDDSKKVSAELSEEEIRQQHFVKKAMIMLGLSKKEIHESAWIEGSIVKNGQHVKRNLRHAALYKYVLYLRKMLKREKSC